MDEVFTIVAGLEALKADLDRLTGQAEALADSDEVRPESFHAYNNLSIYLQESRRSLRTALNAAKSISA